MEIGVKRFYVAYGMNLCDRMMNPNTKDCYPHDPYPQHYTVIKDYKLVFRGNGHGSGLATIEPCKGSEVPVGVWAISESKERDLDRREGFPHLYRKEFVDVEVAGYTIPGEPIKAMVYVMNGDHMLSTPDDYYEAIIREGYGNWHLPVSVLNKAIAEAEKGGKNA